MNSGRFKLILLILISTLFTKCSSQLLTCSDIKIGSSTYQEPISKSTVFIERNDSIQVESSDKMGHKCILGIKWLNDCICELLLKEIVENKYNIPFDKDAILTVKIIEFKKDSYIQTTSSNKSETVFETEIFLDRNK